MKRSAGVTAAAIVAMLGSAFTLFMAVVTGLGLVLVRYLPQRNGIAPMGAVAALGPILFYLALGGCGFATALGILKLRPWSRISMIIFGGFTVVSCVVTGLFMFFIPMPAVPNSNLTASD
jgi:membrane protease YdiL (CAAX protease family)